MILIYEYITGGGLLNEDLTSSLMNEANMIATSINDYCRKSKYFKHNSLRDYRLLGTNDKESIILRDNSKIYDLEFLREYDYVLPVLPEIDMLSLIHI